MEENKNTPEPEKSIYDKLSENHEYIYWNDTQGIKRFLLGRHIYNDTADVNEEILRQQLIYYRMKNKKYGYKKY